MTVDVTSGPGLTGAAPMAAVASAFVAHALSRPSDLGAAVRRQSHY